MSTPVRDQWYRDPDYLCNTGNFVRDLLCRAGFVSRDVHNTVRSVTGQPIGLPDWSPGQWAHAANTAWQGSGAQQLDQSIRRLLDQYQGLIPGNLGGTFTAEQKRSIMNALMAAPEMINQLAQGAPATREAINSLVLVGALAVALLALN